MVVLIFIQILLCLILLRYRAGYDAFLCFIYSCIFTMTYLFCGTELLSVCDMIQYKFVLIMWLSPIIFESSCLAYLIRSKRLLFPKKIRIVDYLSFPFIMFFLIGILILGLSIVTVPYNWDSMAYHLPRIMQWAQNHSVKHYATNYLQQISAPVFAEFVNLHVYVLSGTDKWFNCVQSISFLLNIALVYKISMLIGNNREWSYLSAFLYMTLPIAFAEALTTQNDNVAAFFLLNYVYLAVLVMRKSEEWNNSRYYLHMTVMGFCVGLGLITKTTLLVGFAVCSVWLLLFFLPRKEYQKVICSVIIIVGLAICIYMPESIRRLNTFETLNSEKVAFGQIVSTLSPRLLIMGWIKNFLFNFSNIYVYRSDKIIMKIILICSKLLRVDMNDPAISFHDYKLWDQHDYHHDRAINPIIHIVFVLTVILYLLYGRMKTENAEFRKMVKSFWKMAGLSYSLYLFIPKFNLYGTRYEIGYLALLCPATMGVMGILLKDKAAYQIVIRGILYTLSLFSLISMTLYHLLVIIPPKVRERPYGYFTDQQITYESYKAIADHITGHDYKKVGIYIPGLFEYPLWQMTKDVVAEIRNVNVQNESVKYDSNKYQPECIVYITFDEQENSVKYHNQTYELENSLFDGYAHYYIYSK